MRELRWNGHVLVGELPVSTGVDPNCAAAGTVLTLDLPSPILFKLKEKSPFELPREEG